MPHPKIAWEEFFDAHAPLYDQNAFTRHTAPEVDFLLEELKAPPGASILDVGCGTGRHAVELARRGYSVTGLDLSAGMLARAADSAAAAGVVVEWVRADAARFELARRYDAAICLCEGAFGLLGSGDDPIEQPLAILGNICRSLKPEARFVLTALNAAAMFRKYGNEDVAAGRFDPAALVERSEYAPREGLAAIPVRERAFVATELAVLCRLAGLSVRSVWGGTAGRWGRRPIDLDEIEIMVVASKIGEPIAAPNTG
jgi:SAM-dependent methyltransferase